jgi:hypothetical protein
MPAASLWLKLMVKLNDALLAGSAERELHRHNRDSHDDEKQEIDQNEDAAAVLTDHIRKLPNVPDADRAAGAEQNKAKTAAESFSFHTSLQKTVFVLFF